MTKKKFKLISFNKKEKANFVYKKKIIITDLLLNILIGYYSVEKIKKQIIKVNVVIDYISLNPQNDKSIKSIIDYGKVKKIIKKLTKNKHYNFLESLAEDVFDELFKDKRIIKILLRIEKLNVFKDTKAVGIEIIKRRTNSTNA